MKLLPHFSLGIGRNLRFLLALLFILRFSTSVHADALDHWHWRNPSPPLNPINSVTFGDGKFVAVGAWRGMILGSIDGTNWTQEISSSSHILFGVTHGSNLWVAVGNAGAIVTSPDAQCWTTQNSGVTQKLNAVVYGAGMFTAVGDRGAVVTSLDGINWLPQDSGTNVDLLSVAFCNGVRVAVGTHYGAYTPEARILLASLDGTTWINRSPPFAPLYEWFQSVASGNGIFVVVGWSSGSYYGKAIYSSTDGITWTSPIYDWGCGPN